MEEVEVAGEAPAGIPGTRNSIEPSSDEIQQADGPAQARPLFQFLTKILCKTDSIQECSSVVKATVCSAG